MKRPHPDSLLSKAEVKARLGDVGDKTIERLIREGRLPVVKLGKTCPLRFRELDLRRLIEDSISPGPPAPLPEIGKEAAL